MFHYRANASRYTMNLHAAMDACRSAGADIATPDHLAAAFEDGLDQCDAGWLADRSVRCVNAYATCSLVPPRLRSSTSLDSPARCLS